MTIEVYLHTLNAFIYCVCFQRKLRVCHFIKKRLEKLLQTVTKVTCRYYRFAAVVCRKIVCVCVCVCVCLDITNFWET
jgi:hypothetical protein